MLVWRSCRSRSGSTLRGRVGLGLAAAVMAAIGVAAPGPAHANDPLSWARFGLPGTSTPHYGYDREFAREWEANPPRGYPTLSPDNLGPLKAAIKRYKAVVAAGGWRTIPNVQLRSGQTHAAVGLLRARLRLTADIKQDSSYADYFDHHLERAVKRFQARHGLSPTGVVDKRTIAALNVPAPARLKQLQTNLGRLTSLVRSTGKRYLMVNIPAAQIEAVEGGRVVSRHSAVVGKIDRATPILRSAVHELNFNPVWHLPPTVIEKDLIPKGREMQRGGKSVLAKYGIDAYSGDGRKLKPGKIDWRSSAVRSYTFKQQPGPQNPLGFVKINFHNSHSVYMHDTPSQTLFGRNFRAASSGCVRAQNIEQLTAWLLSGNEKWTRERVVQMRKSGERLDVRLKKPVPLYFVYVTAWATEDGVVQFRRDIYLKDGVGAMAAAY
ncbi:MAG: L,D-transpeptidase family protein [Hyphomicrobiaceae bacterium]|nr:L,D-transpeptidase family protein [Hyphomicrobiaceae bacterium]